MTQWKDLFFSSLMSKDRKTRKCTKRRSKKKKKLKRQEKRKPINTRGY